MGGEQSGKRMEVSVDRMDSCFICGTHGLVGQLAGDPNTVGLHFREAVGEVCGTIEFSAADMDRQLIGFAEWNNAWVEPVDEGSKGNKIQSTRLGYVEH